MTLDPSKAAFQSLWPGCRPLIGMVHLPPLPGSPGWGGSMDAVLGRALADATTLAEAGMDGVLIENYGDVPFHAASVPPETVAAMAAVAANVVEAIHIPVWVNVLRNDARAALAVAAASGARYIRVNVHTGVMWSDQGVLQGQAADTLRVRRALGSDVAILADVHVKHATPPPGLSLGDAAADAWRRGLADALVVSGVRTGAPTDPEFVREARGSAPGAPIIVGSGVQHGTVAAMLEEADGAIVGTSITRGGVAGHGIDADAARRLVEAARQ